MICLGLIWCLTMTDMILTEGLVLQEEKIWKKFLEKEIISESNSCELYFEERDIEKFVQKLEKLYPSIQYVNRFTTHSSGQKVVRFYDLDGNLIEVGKRRCKLVCESRQCMVASRKKTLRKNQRELDR